MWRMAMLTPLRHRSFRLLFAGQFVSDLGDWLDHLALVTLIVYRWELGTVALAALAVTRLLPYAVVGPWAGVWVDRWPRRNVMVAADIARLVVVLGLVWVPNLAGVLALVGIKVTVSTFFGPARQGAIRSIVPVDHLLAANSLSQLSVQINKVAGPALGGVLVAVTSPRAAFALDSLTFLVSAVLVSRLPPLSVPAAQSPTPAPHANRRSWAEMQSGFAYIVHHRALAVTVLSMTMALFLIAIFDPFLALALNELGMSPALLGLAIGCMGFGTAVGSVAIGQWGNRFQPLGIIGAGQLGGGALVALLGAAVTMRMTGAGAGWLLVWLAIGVSWAAMFVPYWYIIQREVPEDLIGRVTAAALAFQSLLQLLAPLIGAAVAGSVGVGFVFAATGTVLALLGVGVLLMRRSLQGQPAPAVVA